MPKSKAKPCWVLCWRPFSLSSLKSLLSLGKQIASSGEGEVWETNLSGYLAKTYHNPTSERIEKLKVMLANPPADPMMSFNHTSIAFPQDLLKDGSGTYSDFQLSKVHPTFAFCLLPSALCLLPYKPKSLYLIRVITAICGLFNASYPAEPRTSYRLSSWLA